MFFRPKNYGVMVNPGLTYAWINIPKNASSFCQKVFDDNGWTMCHTNDLMDGILSAHVISKIVVLRDPVERWISGFSQCMADSSQPLSTILDLLENNAFWTTVFFNPVLDDHTEHQYRFIGNALNVKYIYIQSRSTTGTVSDPNRFYRDLTDYVRSTNGFSNFQYWKEPTNPAENNKKKFAINRQLRAILKENKNYYDKLKNCYKKDYDLINTLERFTV